MKRSENGMVIPFEKFAWDNSKSKLVIRLPLKAIENPLLLYIEFGENTERFCLGEDKAIRQIAENSDLLSKYKGSILMLSEERPFGSLLMDSYDFITNGLQGVTNIFRSMLHSIDSGNSEKASDYKMLEKLWNGGNTFQRIIINYLFCRFYQVKHLAANGTAGIFAYTAERRQEMYSDLEQGMEKEFSLLEHNPTTLSELKQLRYYKRAKLTEKNFVRPLPNFTFSIYPTCRIAAYSLGYALGAESRFSPPPYGGGTTTNVPSCKTKTTSSAVSTNSNVIIFTSSAKRNDTATTIFGVVRLLSAAAKNFKRSTLHFLKSSKESWQSRKRNCKAIMRRRVERLSTLGWRRLSVLEKSLKKNSNLCLTKKSAPLNDLTLRGAEIFLGGMTLRSKTRVTS